MAQAHDSQIPEWVKVKPANLATLPNTDSLVALFRNEVFHAVVLLPRDYEVFDFTQEYDANRTRSAFGVGRYNERRPTMYKQQLFMSKDPRQPQHRDVHVGLDISAPQGHEVRAFHHGVVYALGVNPKPGDYGGTIITEHQIGGRKFWALYGHLSHDSLKLRKAGEQIASGEVVGWLGDESENGGWNPHLHFQLSLLQPLVCDLPGVVTTKDLAWALRVFPDPQLVLGKLY